MSWYMKSVIYFLNITYIRNLSNTCSLTWIKYLLHVCVLSHFSHILLFATRWNPPGSSVHGILQARILQWGALPFSKGSLQPGFEPMSLMSPALAGGFFMPSFTWEYFTKMCIKYSWKTIRVIWNGNKSWTNMVNALINL